MRRSSLRLSNSEAIIGLMPRQSIQVEMIIRQRSWERFSQWPTTNTQPRRHCSGRKASQAQGKNGQASGKAAGSAAECDKVESVFRSISFFCRMMGGGCRPLCPKSLQLFGIMLESAARALSMIEDDRLCRRHVVQRLEALFAAMTGALEAAEGQLDAAAGAVAVDEHLA